MESYVEKQINHYVSVMGFRSFEDLNDQEQISLIKSALSEGFADIIFCNIDYSDNDLSDFLFNRMTDKDLAHDLFSDLVFCYEKRFDEIFEESYEHTYGGRAYTMAWHYADPVAADRIIMSSEFNYYRAMMDSFFKL